jgi:hypothetical protein
MYNIPTLSFQPFLYSLFYSMYLIFKMEKLQAYAASLACPVGAIRLKSPDPLMKKVLEIFPAEVKKSLWRIFCVVDRTRRIFFS